MRRKKLDNPFIKNIIIPEKIRCNQLFQIKLDAEWPNPGWKFDHVDIKIIESKRIVEISYLGYSSQMIAIQKLQKFSDNIDIKLEQPGKWKITIKGRGNDVNIPIEIQE